MTGGLPDRFWAKVDKTDTCWLWTAGRSQGYGDFRFMPGRSHLAHRLAYEELVGPIPAGLTLDHLCRVRHCINPAHLEPVTNYVNLMRGQGLAAQNSRKTHCPQGHPYDAENTYLSPSNRRFCRICADAARKAYEAKNKGAAA